MVFSTKIMGKSWENHGKSWKTMEIHGKIMESHWNMMDNAIKISLKTREH